MIFKNVKITDELIDASLAHMQSIDKSIVREDIVELFSRLSQAEIDNMINADWPYLNLYISEDKIEEQI